MTVNHISCCWWRQYRFCPTHNSPEHTHIQNITRTIYIVVCGQTDTHSRTWTLCRCVRSESSSWSVSSQWLRSSSVSPSETSSSRAKAPQDLWSSVVWLRSSSPPRAPHRDTARLIVSLSPFTGTRDSSWRTTVLLALNRRIRTKSDCWGWFMVECRFYAEPKASLMHVAFADVTVLSSVNTRIPSTRCKHSA